jgi:hypothetical protein
MTDIDEIRQTVHWIEDQLRELLETLQRKPSDELMGRLRKQREVACSGKAPPVSALPAEVGVGRKPLSPLGEKHAANQRTE